MNVCWFVCFHRFRKMHRSFWAHRAFHHTIWFHILCYWWQAAYWREVFQWCMYPSGRFYFSCFFLWMKLIVMIFRYVGYAWRVVHLEQTKGARRCLAFSKFSCCYSFCKEDITYAFTYSFSFLFSYRSSPVFWLHIKLIPFFNLLHILFHRSNFLIRKDIYLWRQERTEGFKRCIFI